MDLLVRHIPTWGGRSGKDSSGVWGSDIQIRRGELRTYFGGWSPRHQRRGWTQRWSAAPASASGTVKR